MIQNNVDITANSDTICSGTSVAIEGHLLDTTHLSSVFWNLPLGYLGPHLVSPNQTTFYYLTIENICGEQQTDSLLLNVHEEPIARIITNKTNGCEEIRVDFSYEYEDYSYLLTQLDWNINLQSYDSDEPQISYNETTDVLANLILSFTNGCSFEYNETIEVELIERPEANFYFNPIPARQGEITEFVDISHGNPQEWEWYLDDNLIAIEERPFYVFEEIGEYSITQIVTNEFGCKDTSIRSLEVIGNYTVYVPNTFTPDGDGFNNSFKPKMSNVKEENYQFLIFDRWGELIYQTEEMNDEWDGNFQGTPVIDGIYVWKILVTDNTGFRHDLMGHVTLLR